MLTDNDLPHNLPFKQKFLRNPFFVLSHEFASLTLKTAAAYQDRHAFNGPQLRPLIAVVARYTYELQSQYTKFVTSGLLINADEFSRDSNRGLSYALRNANVVNHKAATRNIVGVGCQLIHFPAVYGIPLLAKLLSLPGSDYLQWDHFSQLSRLAECGPGYKLPPKLVLWLDRDEAPNNVAIEEHEQALVKNLEIWNAIAHYVETFAQQVIDDELTPNELHSLVNKRLNMRTRGRPAEHRIDYASKVSIPPIEF